MKEALSMTTHVYVKVSSTTSDNTPVNLTEFCRIVGAFQYLTFTRPDNQLAINQVDPYFQAPSLLYLLAVK